MSITSFHANEASKEIPNDVVESSSPNSNLESGATTTLPNSDANTPRQDTTTNDVDDDTIIRNNNNNNNSNNNNVNQKVRQGLVLVEMNAVVNTLTSISKVLDDIIVLTNPPPPTLNNSDVVGMDEEEKEEEENDNSKNNEHDQTNPREESASSPTTAAEVPLSYSSSRRQSVAWKQQKLIEELRKWQDLIEPSSKPSNS